MKTIKAEEEESDVKRVKISDEALIEAFESAVKKGESVDAQNLGSFSRPIARIGRDDMGNMIVLERYDK